MIEADRRIDSTLHGNNIAAAFDPLFRNPHLQSIVAHIWPRRVDAERFPVERRLLRTDPDVQVLVEVQHPAVRERGAVVLVHGLESSSGAGYMVGMSRALLEAGFTAYRLNLRTCGGTESLCPTLYHSGLTADLRALLEHIGRPVHLVGFSLGANVVLKLAGELGEEGRRMVSSVCGVSTPIDLAACCRRIACRDNRLYERRFVRRMRRRLCATGRYRPGDLMDVRSVWEMDERVTAPEFGFRSAAHYYETQSCGAFLDRIRVPALLIQSRDDTFIPFSVFEHPAFRSNAYLRLLATDYGGHLGFLARGRRRFWLESTVPAWISGTFRPKIPSSS